VWRFFGAKKNFHRSHNAPSDIYVFSRKTKCRLCFESIEKNSKKCFHCGGRQDFWKILDFTPGITSGISAVIASLTFFSVIYSHFAGVKSFTTVPFVSIQNDDLSIIVSNQGKRPSQIQSVALICSIGGLEEADFYPDGSGPSQAIIVKQDEVTKISINTVNDKMVGSEFVDDSLSLLSWGILSGEVPNEDKSCAVVVLVVESNGSVRKVANYFNSKQVMITLQRFVSKQTKHQDYSITSLGGQMIGENGSAVRFLVPKALDDYLKSKGIVTPAPGRAPAKSSRTENNHFPP